MVLGLLLIGNGLPLFNLCRQVLPALLPAAWRARGAAGGVGLSGSAMPDPRRLGEQRANVALKLTRCRRALLFGPGESRCDFWAPQSGWAHAA